jgi:endogenous inhibitor of DNA gyrase (YacG/DUF329 family)
VSWSANPVRPFCSVACKLVDLGAWLDERYRIAGDPLPGNAPPESPGPPEAG